MEDNIWSTLYTFHCTAYKFFPCLAKNLNGYISRDSLFIDEAADNGAQILVLPEQALQGYLTSVSLSGYVTESWVESQQFVTESWVESQGYMSASDMSDYLLKTYTSGSVSMMFGPELPYIYLQSSAGNLNARVNLLTMRNTSNYFTQQTPLGYTTQYSSQRAGIWYDADYSSAVLGVRDGGLGLAIDTRNIYLTDNYSSSVISISDLATQTWTSSNYFATSQLWTGTSSQWAALTPEEQAFYTIALITE